jgi:AcrR family transcriptional regulator
MASSYNVDCVHIQILASMLTMSTLICEYPHMAEKSAHMRKKPAQQYHHGNLRAALIAAGLKLIARKGVRALTLREIGTRMGVSRMAAYRHFANKADLLAAIREAGFAEFANALDAARSRAGRAFASRLRAMALAYVRFAAEHPAYYEVMFSWTEPQSPRPSAAGMRAFGILEQAIREGQEAGEVCAGDSVQFARLVWAEVHGISMLRLATDLSPNGAGRRFVQLSCDIHEAGLMPKR